MFTKLFDSIFGGKETNEPDAFVVDRGTIRYIDGGNIHDFNAEMLVGVPSYIIFLEESPCWKSGEKIPQEKYSEIRKRADSALRARGVIAEWEEPATRKK